MVLTVKTKMTMTMKKMAVVQMMKRKLLVQWTKLSGQKYKRPLVQLWLIWTKRFVFRELRERLLQSAF